ncbi:MAG: hypothetical protein CMO81_05470 [Waddliaceae bacterium]|nr:hypothetical protein [Waddliaceae bacterium]
MSILLRAIEQKIKTLGWSCKWEEPTPPSKEAILWLNLASKTQQTISQKVKITATRPNPQSKPDLQYHAFELTHQLPFKHHSQDLQSILTMINAYNLIHPSISLSLDTQSSSILFRISFPWANGTVSEDLINQLIGSTLIYLEGIALELHQISLNTKTNLQLP